MNRQELSLRKSLVWRRKRLGRHVVSASASQRALSVIRPEPVQLEILIQIAVLQVLEHDAVRLFVGADR